MKKKCQPKTGHYHLFKFDLKMRLAFLCFLFSFIGMQAENSFAQKVITLNAKNATIAELLEIIEEETDYRFVYKINDVDLNRRVSVKVRNKKVSKVLDKIFKNAAVEYDFFEDYVFLRKNDGLHTDTPFPAGLLGLFQQDIEITGVVTDENGIPISGVIVKNKMSAAGTNTDFDGRYTIKGELGDILEFSYIGFSNQEVEVQEEEINVVMQVSRDVMDEVIVTAYGRSSKESITGSVASVSNEDIVKRGGTNVFTALRGSAPGIRMNSQSGDLTSAGDIRIRGYKTIHGSNTPLYVIDGVAYSGNISDLNANDIESISILKDANSAALYGNRAANGVIMIETKAGKPNTGSAFEVSAKIGTVDRAIPDYDVLGPDDYLEAYWQGYRNSLVTDLGMDIEEASQYTSANLIDEQLFLNIYNVPNDELFTADGKINPRAQILPGYLGDLNWFKDIERTGLRQDYNFSGRSSSEAGGTYYSIGYLNEEGYVKNNSFNRLTGRVNANYKFNNWLKSGVALSGSHQKKDRRGTADNKNPFLWARNIAPIYPVHEHDPETGEYILDDEGNKVYDLGDRTRNYRAGRHLIWENEKDQLKTIRNTLEANAYVDINFLKDFTFTLRGEMSLRNQEEVNYNSSQVGAGKGDNGRLDKRRTMWKKFTGQQLLNWNKSFGQHNFEMLAGHENYKYSESYFRTYMVDEIFLDELFLNNFTEYNEVNDYERINATESYLSRIKYNFDKKYFAEASFRRDGSSRFAKKNRWGNFWSAGASWIISKENFFKSNKINYLKFRSSYGEVGDHGGAGYYSYLDLFSNNKYDHQAAFYKIQNAAPDLVWETSSTFDIALEGTLFNRANFTIEYYDKRSKNLLFDVNMPLSSGASDLGSASNVITKNLGSISNYGWEFSFDVDVIKQKDWQWNINTNLTLEKNKIVRLPDEHREAGVISGNKRRVEGRSIYDFWMRQFAGVDQMTGNSLYYINDDDYNVNGSNPEGPSIPDDQILEINGGYYTTNPTYAKYDWSGSAFPDVYGGVSTMLTWKNLTLSAHMTYSIGGKLSHAAYSDLMLLSGTASNLHVNSKKAWNGIPEGMTDSSPNRIDPNGIPVIDFSRSGDNNISSNRWLEDASYLEVTNINLNYSFPRNVIEKLSINSLNIYAGVENLATFSKMKGLIPNGSFAGSAGSSYVPLRRFSVGLNISL